MYLVSCFTDCRFPAKSWIFFRPNSFLFPGRLPRHLQFCRSRRCVVSHHTSPISPPSTSQIALQQDTIPEEQDLTSVFCSLPANRNPPQLQMSDRLSPTRSSCDYVGSADIPQLSQQLLSASKPWLQTVWLHDKRNPRSLFFENNRDMKTLSRYVQKQTTVKGNSSSAAKSE